MKVHYLVAAHYNTDVFRELLDAIDAEHSRVYVHVDADVSAAPFRAVANPNVAFVTDDARVHVRWADWSQVESTLALLRHAAPHIEEDDYVVLLSGDSFPTQSPGQALEYFKRESGSQFINSVPMPSKELSKPLSRVSRLYVSYDARDSKSHLLARSINKIGIPRNYKKAFSGRRPFAGSTWWALTGAACHWILKTTDNNPAFVKYCKKTKMPDEFYFQTLLGQSPFSSHTRRSVMFADFSRVNGPVPAFIDDQHVKELESTSLIVDTPGYGVGRVLFVRKIADAQMTLTVKRLWHVSSVTPDAEQPV
jgi:hypothetical protein